MARWDAWNVGAAIVGVGLYLFVTDTARPVALLGIAGGMASMGTALLRPHTSGPPDAPEAPPAPAAPPEPPPDPIPFEVLRARHAERAVALLRPYPPHRAPVGRSRFGGLPDLSPGVPWPRAHDRQRGREVPLHFLAQVDLAELPWRPSGFPTSGTLLFFARVDETMDWEIDPVRVVVDRASSGVRTAAPDDLPPLEDGHHDTERTFRVDGDPPVRVYPSWPLVPAAIETMPDPEAFVANAWHHPAYVDYPAALMRFRAEQLALATGAAVVTDGRTGPFPIWAARDRERAALLPHAESGFPWVAGAVGWIARAVTKGAPQLLDPSTRAALDDARARADARPPAAPLAPDEAQAFVDLLDGLASRADPHQRGRLVHAIDAGLRQLVTCAGGDPDLARALPDAVYEAARPAHLPVTRSRTLTPDERARGATWTRDDHQRVRHHQMFGHVPGSQGVRPIGSTEVTLLQLQSDGGTNLMLCDLGEADFVIEAADLAALRLDRVIGRTAGG